ncbi:zinc finger protein 525-like [Ctenocephalides felis]|uniref:zinc finger protein 525-like n=1 Tax=Ctenocephalides felis TaxID=7515 RepID=UPI000E6E4EFC|nr:zinc finger protein 525-like [Ctenocephalides felis]
MSDATSVSRNNPTIKIEPPDFSIEDVNRENEDEFDSIDGIVKSESPSEDDKTCLQRFMNSEVTIDEEVKQELDDEGEKLFECSICNKAFITKYLLDLHVCNTLEKHSNLNESDKKRAHIGNGSHICEICNKVCSTSTVLVRHLRLHTGERPYKCEICNKGFISSTNLKAHSYTHTGIYPYECERCHKTYRFPTSLKKHMLSHFKRAYECQICKKTFVVLSSLKAHMPIHSEERPYNCGICNKAYTLKGNLKKHMRSHTEEGTL